ncbi:type IV secretion system protein VirB4 [Bifidobacterium sp. ESL0690]|uniref:VirB4-like conjugal transfer ATPase, CD1110 family n=1 Tax=Bifidobacterium sp. ESL0690 TaxID=2983214 RepID=UPI0023FA1DD0|nr:type IV secretion system protein VirB4 [Bifidobacterium sp. ESL0690]WEV47746.1 type IV secretion system protein VirB4 [Bifidobacterium sp. ESL0690]
MKRNRNKTGNKQAKTGSGKPKKHPTAHVPGTVRELIGYDAMLPNGIAHLGDDRWSATLRIGDINYAISTQEHQMDIVDRWGRFLNSLPDGMALQVTVTTRTLDPELVSRRIAMPPKGDRFDGLRGDFNRNVRQLLNGGGTTSSLTDKYLTFTLTERDKERAVTLLNRACLSAQSQLRSVDGCEAHRLDRTERLEVLHSTLRRGQRYTFDEDAFAARRHASTKEWVAPWAIDTHDRRRLRIDAGDKETYTATLWISDFPDYLSDSLIAGLTDIKADISVSIHLKPRTKAAGLKLVNTKIAEMEMQAADERGKNAKRHQPDAYLPHDLQESLEEAGDLRADLKHNGERLIDSLIVVNIAAGSVEELDRLARDVMGVVDGQSCVAETLTYMQVEGLNASLPLGLNPLPMRRSLTTSGAAILIPFTTQELMQPGGVFHGVNARSGNALVVDRTKSMNGNGFILGTTGSGKSQAAKNEIMQTFLTRPDDDLLIIDPEREFTPLCLALGGERVAIGEDSSQHINALDIEFGNGAAGEDGDPIRQKCAAVLNMLDALIGGSDGMGRVERALVDRAVIGLYQELRAGTRTRMPTLLDLQAALSAMNSPEATHAAQSLEIYTTGSLNAFSHPTDVNVHNRFIVYDVMGLGAELKTFGMMVVLDQIWNRVMRNRAAGRRTWLWVDEFHMLFSNPFAADYFLRIYKRARKWGLSVTGITQNIEELLLNDDARLMLANSDFLLLMNQTPTDADTLCRMLKLSGEQREYFTGVQPGQGMLKSGTAFIPFNGRISADSRMYRLFTTKFGEHTGSVDGMPAPPLPKQAR